MSNHEKMLEKFIKVCLNKGFIIFGRYVCEYLRENKKINFPISVYTFKYDYKSFTILFKRHGFKCSKYKFISHTNVDIHRLKIELINAEFFTGKKLYFYVDLYININDVFPPFGDLDFECNALILTWNGILLTYNSGTYMDKFSERERKLKEMEIIKDIKNKITYYFPPKNSNFFDEIALIVDIIDDGWIIKNFNNIIKIKKSKDICAYCNLPLKGEKSIKIISCNLLYHSNCYLVTNHDL